MEIIKGTHQDLDEVTQLYEKINGHLNGRYCRGWKTGVYPTREIAEEGLLTGGLYLVKKDGQIAGTMILNHHCAPGYHQVLWKSGASAQEAWVVHTFAVHPDFLRDGVGKTMLQFTVAEAKRRGLRAVRLDVSPDNLPAIRLYERLGFQKNAVLDLGYFLPEVYPFYLYELSLTGGTV